MAVLIWFVIVQIVIGVIANGKGRSFGLRSARAGGSPCRLAAGIQVDASALIGVGTRR